MTISLTLKPLNSYCKEAVLSQFEPVIAPIGPATTAEEAYLYLSDKRGSWAVVADGKLAGIFAMTEYLGGRAYSTTTYLFSHARGTDINMNLKKAVLNTAILMNQHIVSFVKNWNQRSLNAIQKSAPGVTLTPYFTEDGKEWCWCDYSSVPIQSLTVPHTNVPELVGELFMQSAQWGVLGTKPSREELLEVMSTMPKATPTTLEEPALL